MSRSIPAIPGATIGGAYSEVVEANGLVFVAGQVGDPEGEEHFSAEARDAYDKVRRLLRAVGLDLDRVVRCTVYLRDLEDFAAASEIFRECFPTDPPARTTVAGAALVRGRRIEIEVTAVR